MNKPKKIKRTTLSCIIEQSVKNMVQGQFTSNLPPDFLVSIGTIITSWSHTENAMVRIFKELLHADPFSPIDAVFFSIKSTEMRIQIMRKLLEEQPQNAYKSAEFDTILAEYKSLGQLRNEYAHAEWFQHENGEVYSNVSKDERMSFSKRSVKLLELQNTLERINILHKKINKVASENFFERSKS